MKAIRIAVLASLAVALAGCSTTQQGNGTTWTLDDPARIGGNTAEQIGSPKAESAPVGRVLRFNGESDGLLLPVNPIQGWPEFTIEMLIKPDTTGPIEQRFFHVQDQANFIAQRAFPVVAVPQQSNRYYVYNRSEWNRAEAKLRAPATESAGGGWTLTTDTYFAVPPQWQVTRPGRFAINRGAPWPAPFRSRGAFCGPRSGDWRSMAGFCMSSEDH